MFLNDADIAALKKLSIAEKMAADLDECMYLRENWRKVAERIEELLRMFNLEPRR